MTNAKSIAKSLTLLRGAQQSSDLPAEDELPARSLPEDLQPPVQVKHYRRKIIKRIHRSRRGGLHSELGGDYEDEEAEEPVSTSEEATDLLLHAEERRRQSDVELRIRAPTPPPSEAPFSVPSFYNDAEGDKPPSRKHWLHQNIHAPVLMTPTEPPPVTEEPKWHHWFEVFPGKEDQQESLFKDEISIWPPKDQPEDFEHLDADNPPKKSIRRRFDYHLPLPAWLRHDTVSADPPQKIVRLSPRPMAWGDDPETLMVMGVLFGTVIVLAVFLLVLLCMLARQSRRRRKECNKEDAVVTLDVHADEVSSEDEDDSCPAQPCVIPSAETVAQEIPCRMLRHHGIHLHQQLLPPPQQEKTPSVAQEGTSSPVCECRFRPTLSVERHFDQIDGFMPPVSPRVVITPSRLNNNESPNRRLSQALLSSSSNTRSLRLTQPPSRSGSERGPRESPSERPSSPAEHPERERSCAAGERPSSERSLPSRGPRPAAEVPRSLSPRRWEPLDSVASRRRSLTALPSRASPCTCRPPLLPRRVAEELESLRPPTRLEIAGRWEASEPRAAAPHALICADGRPSSDSGRTDWKTPRETDCCTPRPPPHFTDSSNSPAVQRTFSTRRVCSVSLEDSLKLPAELTRRRPPTWQSNQASPRHPESSSGGSSSRPQLPPRGRGVETNIIELQLSCRSKDANKRRRSITENSPQLRRALQSDLARVMKLLEKTPRQQHHRRRRRPDSALCCVVGDRIFRLNDGRFRLPAESPHTSSSSELSDSENTPAYFYIPSTPVDDTELNLSMSSDIGTDSSLVEDSEISRPWPRGRGISALRAMSAPQHQHWSPARYTRRCADCGGTPALVKVACRGRRTAEDDDT